MRTKILLPLLAIMALPMAGCTSLTGLAKELKDDPAIIVVRIGSPWGAQSLTRIGGQTNSVSVAPDGTVTINPKP